MIARDARPPVPYHARRHLWLRSGEPLVCPNGHRLRHNAALLQHEVFICQHKAERAQGECNSRVYVLSIPGGLRFLTEVTTAEMAHMRDSGMDAEQILAYLQGAAA